MSFGVTDHSEFFVSNDDKFIVTTDQKFYRPRENVWLKRDFALNIFVREPEELLLPRENVDRSFQRLPPQRKIERIYATW